MSRKNEKGIVISNVTNLILLAIGILLLIVVVITLFPGVSSATKGIATQIKKPICCDMLGCKPAAQGGGASLTNPTGSIGCTTFCFGVCG